MASDKFEMACPKCGFKYSIPTAAIGKTATCKECGEKFEVKAPAEAKKPPREEPEIDYDLDLPAPPPRSRKEPMVEVTCGNCGESNEFKKKLEGKKVKCPDCGFENTVPVPPKPKTRTRTKQQCKSCEYMVPVGEAKVGSRIDCPKCKYRVTVEAFEEEATMPPPSDDLDFGSMDSGSGKRGGKAKDNSKAAWVWWPISQWNWKQWVIGIILVIILLNVLSMFRSGGGKDNIQKPAPGQKAGELNKEQLIKQIEAEKERIRAEAEAKAKQREKELQDQLDALKKAKDKVEPKVDPMPMPKTELTFDEYFKGGFKVEYQEAKREGKWEIKTFNFANGVFTGDFDHTFNKGHNGTLQGVIKLDGSITAKMTVTVKGTKEFEFEFTGKVPVDGSKIKKDARIEGTMVYSFVRVDNMGKPVGVVPPGQRIPHKYALIKASE